MKNDLPPARESWMRNKLSSLPGLIVVLYYPVWGPPLRKDQISHLQRLQNRAIRITTSLRM